MDTANKDVGLGCTMRDNRVGFYQGGLRLSVTILAVLFCLGWTRQEQDFLDRFAEAIRYSQADAVLSVYCPDEKVKCFYPATTADETFSCHISTDQDQNGLSDGIEIVYGQEAEQVLLGCRNKQ